VNEVMGETLSLNNQFWEAILQHDASYNGRFFFGVTTTGIFCRPSCKSRHPNKVHVRIFETIDQALSANFRPCKRCRPNEKRLPDEEWVQQITDCIDKHYAEPLSLSLLAEMLHASPYHLHRIFKKIKGITPAEYILKTRITHAQQLLAHPESIADIAMSVGFPNAAHFATVFLKRTGISPSEYRLASHIKVPE
jgi:AraC family transcriptional regulator of adaptative response / methylphosphotriester-DNA alkyltransferase methyltransferase